MKDLATIFKKAEIKIPSTLCTKSIQFFLYINDTVLTGVGFYTELGSG